jgi:hypothetical protein
MCKKWVKQSVCFHTLSLPLLSPSHLIDAELPDNGGFAAEGIDGDTLLRAVVGELQ